jgi:phosphoenolpyruvate-protein kinase (PTS system EI component)
MEKIQQNNKHLYTKELQKTLDVAKLKCSFLEKRLLLIDDEYFNKSAFEKNEADLIKINTANEIAALNRVIKEKEQYFVQYMKQYIEDIDEVESNFTTLVTDAKEKAKTNPELNTFLNQIIWDNLEKNTEAKIYFYKQIKKKIA